MTETTEAEVPFLYQHALEELIQLGYTVENGDLMPPATGIPVAPRAALTREPEAATAPNLSCPSVQARLAAQWGYVRAEAAAPVQGEWRAAVDKLDHLRSFLLGWQGSDSCRRNEMEAEVAKWIDGISDLYRLYDATQPPTEGSPQQPAPQAEPVARDSLIELFAEQLRGYYYCNRVWSAWQVGTMSESDFWRAEETDKPGELADAVLSLYATPQPAAGIRYAMPGERSNPVPEQPAQADAAGEREAFEAWAECEFSDWHRKPPPNTAIHDACWHAFQAGRASLANQPAPGHGGEG